MFILPDPPQRDDSGQSQRSKRRTLRQLPPDIGAHHIALGAKIVAGLTDGLTMAQVAERLGVTVNNLRNTMNILNIKCRDYERPRQDDGAMARRRELGDRIIAALEEGLSLPQVAQRINVPFNRVRHTVEALGIKSRDYAKAPRVAPPRPAVEPEPRKLPTFSTGLIGSHYRDAAERKAMAERANAHARRMKRETRKPTEAELQAMIAAFPKDKITKCPPGAAVEMLTTAEAFGRFYYGGGAVSGSGISKPK